VVRPGGRPPSPVLESPLFVAEGEIEREWRSGEARFEEDLKEFAESQGYQVSLEHTVSGSLISLFSLYRVVQSREFGGFHKVEATQRWQEVAEGLEFDLLDGPDAANQLKLLFEEELLDFTIARALLQKAARAASCTYLILSSVLSKSNKKPAKGKGKEAAETIETADAMFSSKSLRIKPDPEPKSQLEIPSTPENLMGDSMEVEADELREDSSTQSQTDSQRNVNDLREFIERYISMGYSEEVVSRAFCATTLKTGDVGVVIEALQSGHPLPDNIQGVRNLFWLGSHVLGLRSDDCQRIVILR
jgi:hypothetical protein